MWGDSSSLTQVKLCQKWWPTFPENAILLQLLASLATYLLGEEDEGTEWAFGWVFHHMQCHAVLAHVRRHILNDPLIVVYDDLVELLRGHADQTRLLHVAAAQRLVLLLLLQLVTFSLLFARKNLFCVVEEWGKILFLLRCSSKILRTVQRNKSESGYYLLNLEHYTI